MPPELTSPPALGASKLAPILDWLPRYELGALRADILAGVTLAAYAVPVSLAYASLAGVPPQTGLYCYLLGGLGYACFGSSRHLAVGPTSAIALLLGVSLGQLSAGDISRQASLASLTALLMAGVFLLAWLLRLSVLVNFISESILVGFKAGAALVIAATQFPKLLGVPGGGDDFFERLGLIGGQLTAVNAAALSIGVIAIALLIAGEKFLPGRPIALTVVLLAIYAVAFGGLERFGIHLVGDIPAGLPAFRWVGRDLFGLTMEESRQVVRLACACFLLSYIESVSAARTFALKHHDQVDPRQELLGLGAASFLAGLWQGFPLAGGLSQTAVNERGGARSPMSLIVASLSIGCVLLFLTDLFRTLPDTVLAAVVLVAVKGLIDVGELIHLWRVNLLDFAAAVVALGGVLLMGVLDGVLIAVLASLVMLLWRASRPQVAFLGRIPGTDRFSDIDRHAGNEILAGVLAFRVQGSLLYFNVDHISAAVHQRADIQPELRRVLCDLSNAPYVDIAGARMLRRMFEDFQSKQIDFRIVECHGVVREVLRAEGLETLFGTITRRNSLAAWWTAGNISQSDSN